MTIHSFRTSRPDNWTRPRPHTDPSLRLQTYGKIESADWASDSKRGTIRLTLLIAVGGFFGILALYAMGVA